MRLGNGMWHAIACVGLAPLLLLIAAGGALAQGAPSEIRIGTLYAASGNYAAISMPVYSGLRFWIDQKNAEGGVFVKAFSKKIPIHLISYDDQSNTATAATLYNQLITQDKVDILISDSGSVLTSVAVPIARDHKMLLWDITGSSPNFFSADNPYIVLLALAATDRYPKSIADFVAEMPKLGIKNVAILYNTADYTAFQATAVRKAVEANPNLKLVFDRGVPANTTDYTLLVNNVEASQPDALLEFGYPANEIAFLRALQDNGSKFKFLFTGYGLTEMSLMQTNGVADQLMNTYALAAAASYARKPQVGLDLPHLREAFEKWVEDHHQTGVEFGFNALAGYQAGLVIENALAEANSLDQLELRRAVFTLSGKLVTLDGPFILAPDGSQSGEILPLGQIMPGKNGAKDYSINIVWPPELATAKPLYPAP